MKIKRNPTTAVFYVIVPIIAITIFSVVAYLLPPSEGKSLVNLHNIDTVILIDGKGGKRPEIFES